MTLTTRALTTEDAEDLAALLTRISVDHPIGFELSTPEVRELMSDYPRMVLDGGWVDGDLVAFTVLLPSPADQGVHPVWQIGDVDPARLGEGIGTAMLGRAIEAAHSVHATEAPQTALRLTVRALAGRDDQVALLVAHGLVAGRHNFMMFSDLTDVPAPVLPDDLALETFAPAQADELRRAHDEAFRDYPDHTATDETHWHAFMVKAAHARHEQSFVLRDPAADGRVAAYVFVHEYENAPSGEGGREAYVAYVGTLAPYRRRGLATHLLAHTLRACRDAGFDTSSLDVDTENPTGALGIYERAGYAVRHRQDDYVLREEPLA
ncbi:GNAT family N-acetyltransferase [Nocardioides currus]|uniref:N-acetyltransferase domain-containing protein n=1 Tax=Nocardioides currus TaxID=2133958 RepID=A0A2R7YU26_9ACTN|nr:GNAT family N-acetyltransferase [Nocardioides currus]PUA79586.1 hypothetical protein C7S10_17825 [Nocardioides currus]